MSDMFAAAIIPPRHVVEDRVATLAWQDEAGGYAFGLGDILAMDLDQMDRYIRTAYKRRKERADAIKSAAAKARGKRRR